MVANAQQEECLQISFDSCKLREGQEEGDEATIFSFHSPRAKPQSDGLPHHPHNPHPPSFFLISPEGNRPGLASHFLAYWRNFWRTDKSGDTRRGDLFGGI